MSCQQVPTTPAFNLYPRSVQVGEFEVAIDGGIWVAIRDYASRDALASSNFCACKLKTFFWMVESDFALNATGLFR
jgi:hypothetical protein